MNGEQQKLPTAKDKEKKPCVCSKSDVQKSDGCAKCGCQDGPHLVQVSVLWELSPNKRKRDEAIRKLVEVVRFAFVAVLAFLATSAIDSIDTGNVFLDLAVIVSIYCFICYGLCMAVFRLIDNTLDV